MGKMNLNWARARPMILMLVLWCAAFDAAKAQGELGLGCAPRLLAVAPGGTQTLTVSVSTAPATDVVVNLSSDNPAVASVPATVTIPAGQTTVPVTVSGVARGATFITATTDSEQATSNVYVAARFSGDMRRLPAAPLRVTIQGLTYESPLFALPLRVLILPVPFAITQPVRADVRNP